MPGPYSLGPVHANTKSHATFETKPSGFNGDGSRDTGGGYERWRSYESVPTHYGQRRKKEVYVAVHRLCAVAWCYPASWSVAEILADMDGTDVHHRDGVEWNNSEDNLELLDHAEHSSLTQAELRAVTADRKADVEAAEDHPYPTTFRTCAHRVDTRRRCWRPAPGSRAGAASNVQSPSVGAKR